MKPLSAFLIFGGPVLVILAFWLLARRERLAAADPHARTFAERNGWPVATYLVAAVGADGIWPLISQGSAGRRTAPGAPGPAADTTRA